MKTFTISALLSIVLMSCGPTGGWEETKKNGARIVIDGVSVNWGVTPALGKHTSGNDLALFTFTSKVGDKVTGARLTIAQRVEIGSKALQAHPNCRWVGFDASVNRVQSYRLGAVDDILVAPVDC